MKNQNDKVYYFYGDNTRKNYTREAINEFFELIGEDNLKCIKSLNGNKANGEYFTFAEGLYYSLRQTNTDSLRIR